MGRHQHGVYTLWMDMGIRTRTGSPPKPCFYVHRVGSTRVFHSQSRKTEAAVQGSVLPESSCPKFTMHRAQRRQVQ